MATIISLISYPFLPAKVGGQKGVALFNKYFSTQHRLICVTVKNNDPAFAEGYELLNILSNSKFRYINPFYYFKLRRVIKKYSASHLILEHPYYGWLGVLLKWFAGIKLVVHSHNIEGLRWKTLGKWWWSILWSYEKWTHRQADYNFFIHDDDRDYAIANFKLSSSRCITMTYGIEWDGPPSPETVRNASSKVRSVHQITPEEKILLFNGAFNYSPNLDALQTIIGKINPLLQNITGFHYRIIVCGRDIPPEILSGNFPNMIITGFVDDISLYFKAADVFINPINEGGGIKTKLVEALGNNANAVSTIKGATGIDPNWCYGKLVLIEDGDWNAFTNAIVISSTNEATIPAIYFEHFYWGYTTKKAAAFIAK